MKIYEINLDTSHIYICLSVCSYSKMKKLKSENYDTIVVSNISVLHRLLQS